MTDRNTPIEPNSELVEMNNPSITKYSNSHNRRSRILSLPSKIRHRIRNYCIKDTAVFLQGCGWFNPDVINDLDSESYFFQRKADEGVVEPHLLRVCKLINREATPIFYANTFIDIVYVGTVLNSDTFTEFILRLELLSRPRPYNIKSLLMVLHCDGGSIDMIRQRQLRDSSILGHYVDVISRQCGTLGMLHIQMVDWSMNHIFGPNDGVAVPLMRGLGFLDARKATFGMLGYGICFDLQLVIERDGARVPLKFTYDQLCIMLRDGVSDGPDLLSVTLEVFDGCGLRQPELQNFIATWQMVLEQAKRKVNGIEELTLEEINREFERLTSNERNVSETAMREEVDERWKSFESAVMNKIQRAMNDLEDAERKEVEAMVHHYERVKNCEDLLEG
ncbi:hypothetical protein DM02DRAFT_651250 [Periconia macrospinosa]|uniref:F-box domain-containing protein n=1 Tax=Periconia macrospinosa TaxID=97972 RepID=A0A2V1E6A6_9PLEO|nr:hypothetical protein DM02DRAFT_651250 [Periconia macrospinosa]